MTQSPQLAISLPRYEGPFDLLLALIRRNEYSIDALPVAEITGRFLAWVRAARDLDANLGAEFVEVASWLVLLQSRSLLPREAELGVCPQEELRRAVLDHQTLRATAEFLQNRAGKFRFGRSGVRTGGDEAAPEPADSEAPTVQDVLEATRRALEAARAARSFEESEDESATVEEMVDWVSLKLSALPRSATASTGEWFAAQTRGGDRSALLLALLEMSRNGVLFLHQEEDFRVIYVKSSEEYADFKEYES